MFDSVLGRGVTPKSRFGSGAVVSVLLHVGLLGFALWFSTRPPAKDEKDVTVVLKVAPPPPPPPPPPASTTKKHTEVKKHPKDKILQPKEVPQDKPKEAEPNDEPDGVEGGVAGGVAGGVVGGVVGGTLGGQLGSTTLSFGEGMTRPVLQSSPNGKPQPDYSREALEAHIEGLMIVKCVITAEGKVQSCNILKPVPHMESAVLSWLTQAKYSPVTFQGKPQQVSYVFNFNLKLRQ